MHTSTTLAIKTLLFVVYAALALPAGAQMPAGGDMVGELKSTMEASQAMLRQYEWIETTVISSKGEEKVRKQQRCYYGADGGVQKVELTATPPPEEKRGIRGKIVAKAKENMTDYMKSAVALVKSYVPPDPRKLQAAKDAGKVSIDLLPNNRARMNFRDYLKPGDQLSMEVDMADSRPLGMSVATYLESTTDAVTLNVRMDQLNDGTVYPSNVTLEAKAKNLTVAVTNSGYRRP